MTNLSIITTGQAEKKGVGSAQVGSTYNKQPSRVKLIENEENDKPTSIFQLYADYAVLDGDLTTTIPPK